MASRAAAGGRPGARFAQFKLVLLGWSPGPPLYLVKGDSLLMHVTYTRRICCWKGWTRCSEILHDGLTIMLILTVLPAIELSGP